MSRLVPFSRMLSLSTSKSLWMKHRARPLSRLQAEPDFFINSYFFLAFPNAISQNTRRQLPPRASTYSYGPGNRSHVVLTRSSAALFYEDMNTRLKAVAVLQMLSDRPTISLTHSERASYISLPTVILLRRLLIYRPTVTTVGLLLFKLFTNITEHLSSLS